MKQTLLVNIEIEQNDTIFTFTMPYGCKIGDAYNAAHACLQEIIKMSQQSADAAKAQSSAVDTSSSDASNI